MSTKGYVEEGDWQNTSLRVLNPGMDFKDGVLWYTTPISRINYRVIGKDDNQKRIPFTEHGTRVINSKRESMLYDPINCYEQGFQYPTTFVQNPTGWGGMAADRWVAGEEAPEAWELYQRIRAIYVDHIEFADEMLYDFMSLYIMATYFYRVFDTFLYLHFGGTKASGKSQNMRIIKVLGFNASMSTNMTAADLYRSIAGNPGVTCIDEAENWRSERGASLLEILRNGYKKGGNVYRQRQNEENTYDRDEFDTYGPKVLASIQPLDPTTASRAIKIAMRPALRPIEDFRDDPTKYNLTRDHLHYFGLANAQTVADTYEKWRSTEYRAEHAATLDNRAWEISSPIVVMADYVGGDALTVPLIEWLAAYFEQERKHDDSLDNIRTLVISLPTLIRGGAAEGWYYPLKNILDTYKQFVEEDSSDKTTTRTVLKWLTPIGFTDLKTTSGGKQVRIVEDDLRTVFNERRIEPRPEDAAWLAGTTSYQDSGQIEEEAVNETLEFGAA